ncbi:MAG: tetratricopeptide repeat protein [Deltaproteobacteria bacterium]|nr:tetratricopeptide repeat protein [Deltaproteobacteria bacterium]
MSEEPTIFTCTRNIVLLTGLFVFSVGAAAAAAPPDNPAKKNELHQQQARAYFTAGETHFEAGEYQQAVEAFTKAYDIVPHFAVLANIGLAAEQSGDYVLAVTSFKKYLAQLEKAGKQNSQVEVLLKDTLQKVAELIVTADRRCETCRIQVDNHDYGIGQARLFVLPGEHRLTLVENETATFSMQVSVFPGETRRVTLAAPAVGPPAPQERETGGTETAISAEPREDKKRTLTRPQRVAIITTIGAGVAAGVLWGAAVFTHEELENSEDYDEQTRLKKIGERRQVEAVIATGIAGVAGLTACILTLVRHRALEKYKKEHVSLSTSRDAIAIGVRF